MKPTEFMLLDQAQRQIDKGIFRSVKAAIKHFKGAYPDRFYYLAHAGSTLTDNYYTLYKDGYCKCMGGIGKYIPYSKAFKEELA